MDPLPLGKQFFVDLPPYGRNHSFCFRDFFWVLGKTNHLLCKLYNRNAGKHAILKFHDNSDDSVAECNIGFLVLLITNNVPTVGVRPSLPLLG